MEYTSRKRIIYGEANYKNLILDNGYYVDKTGYIPLMETYKNPVFLRPRRFGKSLWCTTLQYYYDINETDEFEKLFGHTAIGKNPTPMHNCRMVLPLDFSIIDPSGGIEEVRFRFNRICNMTLQSVLWRYKKYFGDTIGELNREVDASIN